MNGLSTQVFSDNSRQHGFLRAWGFTTDAFVLFVFLVLLAACIGKIASEWSSSSSASASCSASSRRLHGHRERRLGSGAAWYCHEWEKDFVEAVSTVCMILLALGFEHIYHHLLHKAEHAFVYGQSMLSDEEKAEHVDRGAFGKPLALILLSRMAGEFMVLGFLAFMIWVCNQQNIFAVLAKISASDMNLPSVGDDYLHMMEEVHMQLFVAMIIYFALALKMTIGADEIIKEFELNRTRWIEQIHTQTDTFPDTDPDSLREFKAWRGIFLSGCVKEIFNWQVGNKKEFQAIMKAMQISQDQLDEGKVREEDIRDCCAKRLSFCTYLVFSVCAFVHEYVNMGYVVMLAIICVKLFFAILHRGGHLSRSKIAPVINMFCFIDIVTLYLLTHKFKKMLQVEDQTEWLQWLHVKLNQVSRRLHRPEKFVLSLLQVLIFYLCHSWAGLMIDKNFWDKIFEDGDMTAVVEALMYILALLGIGFILPRCVPDFAAIMSLSPFFSRSNGKIVHLVAVQVVDAKMVAARKSIATHRSSMEAAAPGSDLAKEVKDLEKPVELEDPIKMPAASGKLSPRPSRTSRQLMSPRHTEEYARVMDAFNCENTRKRSPGHTEKSPRTMDAFKARPSIEEPSAPLLAVSIGGEDVSAPAPTRKEKAQSFLVPSIAPCSPRMFSAENSMASLATTGSQQGSPKPRGKTVSRADIRSRGNATPPALSPTARTRKTAKKIMVATTLGRSGGKDESTSSSTRHRDAPDSPTVQRSTIAQK